MTLGAGGEPTTGVVRSWDDEQGWGVIDSAATPGGCWAHFSVLAPGWEPRPGEPVTMGFEEAEQDGFIFRALAVWPHGNEQPPLRRPSSGSGAYSSTFSISLDQAPGTTRLGSNDS